MSGIKRYLSDNAYKAAEHSESPSESNPFVTLSNLSGVNQSGYIKPTDAAPTPARNGNYTFSIGGNKPAWLTAEAGITTVKAGDGVAVVYSAPSSYTYTHIDLSSKLLLPMPTFYKNKFGFDEFDLNKGIAVYTTNTVIKGTGFIADGNTLSLSDNSLFGDVSICSKKTTEIEGTWLIFQLSVIDFTSLISSNKLVNISLVAKTELDLTIRMMLGLRDISNIYTWFPQVPSKNIDFKANEETFISLQYDYTNIDTSNKVLQVYFYLEDQTNIAAALNTNLFCSPIKIYTGRQLSALLFDKTKPLKAIVDKITDVGNEQVTTYIDGYFIDYSNGVKRAHASWRIVEITDIKNYYLNATLVGGIVVALISYYNGTTFLCYQEKGTGSSTVVYTKLKLIIPEGTTKIIISTNIDKQISLFEAIINPATINYVDNKTNGIPPKVQTWGNSITAAGVYQKGIKTELGIEDVKNAGIASDFSMHIRNRFISYFTDETPYVGTGIYTIPSLTDRLKELQESFFVFWIGTNNLINTNRQAGTYTTGSPAYMALQPNPNFKYDRLFSKSYIDMVLNDISQMVAKLPHGNFAIIGGHGGFMAESEMRTKMIELDNTLVRLFPRNVIDVRELVLMDYNYLNTFLAAAFVKPALNANVDITVTDGSWILDANKNASSNICIGTKDIYDKYNVISKSGNIVTAKLIESNTEFSTGETMLIEYDLVSDLGRDAVTLKQQIYSYDDVVAYSLRSFPRSCSDPIHFTNETYVRIGQLIGKEIKKINRN